MDRRRPIELLGRLGRLARGRRVRWSLITVAAITAALAGTTLFVQARANERDHLRQAQIALASLPGGLGAVEGSTLSLLAGRPPNRIDFGITTNLRRQLAGELRNLTTHWRSPMAHALSVQAASIDAHSAELMALVARRQLAAANSVHSLLVRPEKALMESEIARAQNQLDRQVASAGSSARTASWAIVAIATCLLVLLFAVTGRARRRGVRHEAEKGVRDSAERLRVLVEHGPDVIAVMQADTTVVYLAGAVEALLGVRAETVEGTRLVELVTEEDEASFLALCEPAAAASRELRFRGRDGQLRTCQVNATSLLDDPAWEGIVLNIWDLSDRKALEERLRYQAFHDGLTGLPNRVLAIDRAKQMLARVRRHSVPVAALYIDLDGFKEINDTYGHAAGDELLQMVAARIETAVRDCDTAARLGGDEFLVLLEEPEPDAGAALAATRILSAIRESYILPSAGDAPLRITASIGIATRAEGTADELLGEADNALYEAKRAGRDCYAHPAGKVQAMLLAAQVAPGSPPADRLA